MQDKWDKLWLAWKNDHLAILQESEFPEDYVNQNMKSLFDKLEEHTVQTVQFLYGPYCSHEMR